MDRRTIFIMIAASWILMIFMIFNAPQTKEGDKDKDQAANVEKEQDADGKDSDGKEQDDAKTKDDGKTDDGKTEDGKSKDGQTKSKDDEKKQDAKSTGSNGGDGQANKEDQANKENKDDSKSGDDSKSKSEDQEPSPRILEQKFISLGSLAADSPYRFLVTLDNQAASIHRLELVQRRKRNNERLKYKDLEVLYGYLGHLDLQGQDSGGCLVRTVGPGTPAHDAGIQVGDEIVKFNDQAIESRFDYEKTLRTTKPGEQVSITLLRDGNEITLSATTMRQPLEVIRPTIVPEIADFAFEKVATRKSYSISIFEPVVGKDWEPLGNAHEDTWESEVGEDYVKFYYPYKSEQETKDAKFDFQVIKTFRLKTIAEGERDDISSMNYHLDFDVEIKNLSDQPRSFAYRVDGPNGLPTEDWWFAIKIHGEWAAVFSQAGARDIVASTSAKSFHFIGGPKVYSNGTKSDPKQRKPIYVIDPGNDNGNAHQLKYIGVDSHYFVSALIPTDGESIAPREAYSAYAMPQYVKLAEKGEEDSIKVKRKTEAKWYRKLVPVNFKAYFIFEKAEGDDRIQRQQISPNQSLSHSFMIFAGPKEPSLLQKYDIDDTVTFGWFAAFSWPLVKLLHLFFAIIGNYAIAIVLLTILVRLAMMRFSRKMVLNSQMMQLLAPEIKAIAEKYKDDFQAKSKAQQELFRKYNYNPFSGCLVMLIQLPVFIGLYRGLSVDMALRDQALIPGVSWCSNLAGPDQLWRWADDLPSFLSFLTHETGWLGPYFNVLPIISVVLMLIQQKLFTPPAADEQQAMMQKVMTFMMIFIGIIFFKVPAGLCIYFITSTLWAIMEKKLIPPPQLPEHLQKRLDELKALQAKEKEDGVEPGTYTKASTTAGGNATRKHTERAKKRSQKNRRK